MVEYIIYNVLPFILVLLITLIAAHVLDDVIHFITNSHKPKRNRFDHDIKHHIAQAKSAKDDKRKHIH